MIQDHYFVSYEVHYEKVHPFQTYDKKIKNAVIDKHPLEWIKTLPELEDTQFGFDCGYRNDHPTVLSYNIIFYDKISRQLYKKYKI